MKKVICDHIINVKSDVEVQQKDPNSPLYSVKTFEELRLYVLFCLNSYTVLFERVVFCLKDSFCTTSNLIKKQEPRMKVLAPISEYLKIKIFKKKKKKTGPAPIDFGVKN